MYPKKFPHGKELKMFAYVSMKDMKWNLKTFEYKNSDWSLFSPFGQVFFLNCWILSSALVIKTNFKCPNHHIGEITTFGLRLQVIMMTSNVTMISLRLCIGWEWCTFAPIVLNQ